MHHWLKRFGNFTEYAVLPISEVAAEGLFFKLGKGRAYGNINIPSAFENTKISSVFKCIITRGAFENTNIDIFKVKGKATGLLYQDRHN